MRLALFLLMFAAVLGAQNSTLGNFTTTISTTTGTTVIDLPPVDTFLTRILGTLQGGATVYDMTFALPLADPVVQAAVQQARDDLAAASADPLAFLGPSLISSLLEQIPHSAFDHNQTSVTSSTVLGPATILVGENQSEEFFVAAGTVNVNVNTHTQVFENHWTENRLSQTYQVTGAPLSEVPEPGTMVLCAAGLAVLGWRRIRSPG